MTAIYPVDLKYDKAVSSYLNDLNERLIKIERDKSAAPGDDAARLTWWQEEQRMYHVAPDGSPKDLPAAPDDAVVLTAILKACGTQGASSLLYAIRGQQIPTIRTQADVDQAYAIQNNRVQMVKDKWKSDIASLKADRDQWRDQESEAVKKMQKVEAERDFLTEQLASMTKTAAAAHAAFNAASDGAITGDQVHALIEENDALKTKLAQLDDANTHLAVEATEATEKVSQLRDELASPRYLQIPESGHILRRCESCGGLCEMPSQLSQVGVLNCPRCAAEKQVEQLRAALSYLSGVVGNPCVSSEVSLEMGLVKEVERRLNDLKVAVQSYGEQLDQATDEIADLKAKLAEALKEAGYADDLDRTLNDARAELAEANRRLAPIDAAYPCDCAAMECMCEDPVTRIVRELAEAKALLREAAGLISPMHSIRDRIRACAEEIH